MSSIAMHPLPVLSTLALALMSLPAQASDSTLQPVVVTSEAPSHGPVTRGDLRQTRAPLPASDAADYLMSIPGFSAQRSGGTNSDPVLRGLGGSRLALWTDGGQILGACPNRMDAPSSYVSPDTFDHFEVVKGPQTVLWGPVGTAGTIRFERDTERFDQAGLRGRITLLGGRHGRFGKTLDLAAGEQRGYVRVIGQHDESGDYRDGDGDRVPSRWEKWNGDLILGYTPDADTRVELTAGAGDGEARYAGRGMDGTEFSRESYGLRLTRALNAGALQGVDANLYYHRAEHVMDNFRLRPPPASGGAEMAVARETWGARVETQWQWARDQLQAGLDLQQSRHANEEHHHWVDDARFGQVGAFAEWSRILQPGWTWIAGARLDHWQVKDLRDETGGGHGHGHGHGHGATPNPTADQRRRETLASGFTRLEWEAHPGTLVHAGLGYAQRAPDYWELFSSADGPMGSVNAFAAIDPETVLQLDLGVQHQAADWNAWVSAYVGRINDFILFRDAAHGGMTMTHVEQVDAWVAGAEAGLGLELRPGWHADLSVAYAHGRNRDDHSDLPQMPPLEGRLDLHYEQDRWSAGVLLRAVAAQHRVAPGQGNVVGRDFDTSASFTTVTLHGAWQVTPDLNLSAGLDNLFSETYAEHLNKAGVAGFGYPAETRINEPGRQLWVKADYRF